MIENIIIVLNAFLLVLFLIIVGGYWLLTTKQQIPQSHIPHDGLPWLFVSKLLFCWSHNKYQKVTFTEWLPFFSENKINYASFLQFFTKESKNRIETFLKPYLTKQCQVSGKKINVYLNLGNKLTHYCSLQIISKDKKKKYLIANFSNFSKISEPLYKKEGS